jgi:hypothetical protein
MAYVVYHFSGATKKTAWHQEATLSDAVTTMRRLCQGCVSNIVVDEYFDVEFQTLDGESRDKVTIFANFRRLVSETGKHRHDVSKVLDTTAEAYAGYVAHCPTDQSSDSLETFAVVSQEANNKPWVSATSDFATALQLYEQQLEDDEPRIDQDVFTYSRTQNKTWTGIIRDPAQAKAICNKNASSVKCYNKLVLYHVDSGYNVANTEPSTD